jgi:hypothetical protein
MVLPEVIVLPLAIKPRSENENEVIVPSTTPTVSRATDD